MQRPSPRLIRTSKDAELAARDWFLALGFTDAYVLPGAGPDGGVDVVSSAAVAQVKATVGPAGRPIIQQIYGIASHESKQAVVFSIGGFTPEAVDWANSARVSLFQLDLSGDTTPANRLATELIAAAELRAARAKTYQRWEELEPRINALKPGKNLFAKDHRLSNPTRWYVQRERTTSGFELNAWTACESSDEIFKLLMEIEATRTYSFGPAIDKLLEVGQRWKGDKIQKLATACPYPPVFRRYASAKNVVMALKSHLRTWGYEIKDFVVTDDPL